MARERTNAPVAPPAPKKERRRDARFALLSDIQPTALEPAFEREHDRQTWKGFIVRGHFGKSQGHIGGRQQFTWSPEKCVIMLGINYVGWIDDLTIFDRALVQEEIMTLAGQVDR